MTILKKTLPLALLLSLAGCATPLMKAARDGQTEQVKAILDGGVDAKSKQGSYAVAAAAETGRVEVLKLLLSRGADPNAMGGLLCPNEVNGVMKLFASGQPTPQMAPAIAIAAFNGHAGAVKALVEGGADLNKEVPKTMQWPCNNYTALIFAAKGGSLEIVQYLLDKGANRNAKGGRFGGKTALEWAQKAGNTEVVAMLESAGTESAADRLARAEKAKKAADAATKAALDAVGGGAAQPAASEPAAAPAPKPKSRAAVDSQL